MSVRYYLHKSVHFSICNCTKVELILWAVPGGQGPRSEASAQLSHIHTKILLNLQNYMKEKYLVWLFNIEAFFQNLRN